MNARTIAAFLALTASYWFLASYGLQWANVAGAGSPIWPAAGLAIAGLALGGVRLWPAIFLGRILTAVTIGSSNPAWVVVAIAAGNALAAALPVLLMQRIGRVDLRLATLRDVLWVIGVSGLSAVLAATIGTSALVAGDALPPHGALTTWTDWISGNFAGAVVLGPLLLAWSTNGMAGLRGRAALHMLLMLAFVTAVGWAILFTAEAESLWRTWHLFPALVWAALAFQVRGASLAILILSLFAVVGVSGGAGPFVMPSGAASPSAELLIQQFVGLTGATILILAAAVDERRAKEALQRAAEEVGRQKRELETLYREAPVGLALLDAEGRVLRANEALQAIDAPAPDAPSASLLPSFAESITALHRRVLASGEPIAATDVAGAPDAGRLRHLLVSAYPLTSQEGVQAVGYVVQETTEQKDAAERERLLAREVDHRAKNLLAVIQGIVQLTRAESANAFATAIIGRIQALGRAHSLLSASRWEGADLRQLVVEELAPFLGGDRPRATIRGPHLQLRHAAAQSLALGLHELATNAAKHGSLSVEGGTVAIEWRLAPAADPVLELHWTERGGPPVAPPARRGFGATLLRSSVERQLKGSVTLDWQPEGLVCELRVPAMQLALVNEPARADPVAAPRSML